MEYFDCGQGMLDIPGPRRVVDWLDPLADNPADLVHEEVQRVPLAHGDVGQEEG